MSSSNLSDQEIDQTISQLNNIQLISSRDFARIVTISTIITQLITTVVGITCLLEITINLSWVVATAVIWGIAVIISIYGVSRYQELIVGIDPNLLVGILTDLKSYKNKLRRKENQQSAVQASLAALEEMLGNYSFERPLKDHINYLLDPLVVFRRKALDFEGVAVSNFVLYVYDEVEDILKLLWRYVDEEYFDREGYTPLNRSFKRGVGHPGITFNLDRPWIVGDATTEKFPDLFQDEHEERDKKLYRTFMSIPIRIPTKGVVATFTITSNKKYQFNNQEYNDLCHIYMSILSTYFYSRYIRNQRQD